MKLTQEPEFTTSKNRTAGAQKDKIKVTTQTIDYIFYTKEFVCSRILGMTKDKIEALYMPGWRYPSDHFCIAADMILPKRRRMAQRERSNCRDSPVMVRLLQEICDAQNENN